MANRGGKHGDIVGAVGTPPPPGAPIEYAQALRPEAVADMASKAAKNATDLPPFQPAGGPSNPTVAAARAQDVAIARAREPKVRPAVVTGPETQTTPVNAAIILTDAPDAPRMQPGDTAAIIKSMGEAVLAAQADVDAQEAVELTPTIAMVPDTPPAMASAPTPDLPPQLPTNLAPPKIEGKLGQAARDLLSSRLRSAQPAASNTDSPARGIPHESTDPGRKITGGFGDAIDQQYFPLDGSELRSVVQAILKYLDDQMQNDLRFSVALCYPRVRAQVTISIQGYTSDMDFALTRGTQHDKTPVEIAEAHGDQPVAFTLDGTIEEMTHDGESVMPPNAMRESLGLQVPRKERIQMPTGGFSVVDRRN